MADTLKGAQITALDAQPFGDVQAAGFGAPAYDKFVNDFVTATAAGLQANTSTYRLIRLPSTAVVKAINLETITGGDTGTNLTVDVGAYYSDSPYDGTQVNLQGALISANCFLANTAFGQSSAKQRLYSMTALAANLRNSPLWLQCGLTSDPGGFIDIVVAVHTAASTGIQGAIMCQVAYNN